MEDILLHSKDLLQRIETELEILQALPEPSSDIAPEEKMVALLKRQMKYTELRTYMQAATTTITALTSTYEAEARMKSSSAQQQFATEFQLLRNTIIHAVDLIKSSMLARDLSATLQNITNFIYLLAVRSGDEDMKAEARAMKANLRAMTVHIGTVQTGQANIGKEVIGEQDG